jgi:uncharacterized membrane protein required for colicin V production
MMGAGTINAIVIAILVIGVFIGFAKGFLGQVLELLGIVASFILASLLGGAVATFLEERFDIPYSPALVVSFAALVILGLIASHFLANAIQKAIRLTILEWVDRFAGAGLGLVMGLVVASLIITLTLELPVPKDLRKGVERSSMGMFVRPVAGQIFNWIVAHGPKAIHYEEIFKRSRST